MNHARTFISEDKSQNVGLYIGIYHYVKNALSVVSIIVPLGQTSIMMSQPRQLYVRLGLGVSFVRLHHFSLGAYTPPPPKLCAPDWSARRYTHTLSGTPFLASKNLTLSFSVSSRFFSKLIKRDTIDENSYLLQKVNYY